ncbi:FUSC family protein [Kitasatospora sp. NPDC057223]|uniref:FUSC family protein n=1 Tax=Kitasatospora sp. NPDC057223 TaxID=3346055 RepID=UPI003635D446
MAGQLALPSPRPRRLPPLRQVLRIGAAGDGWHRPAASAVTALAAIDLTLLALGRLDLALYTSAGALVALYGHGLPYPARARTLAGVAAGTVASTGVALAAAALTGSVAVLVAVSAVLAALHKIGCDAARVGPPGNIIITFTSASCAFVPGRPGDLPFHLALTAAGAALAWLVCMAPALIRPYGPERIAVARALEAAARLLRSGPDRSPQARTALAGAVNAARRALARPAPGRHEALGDGLERLLIRGESALAPGADRGRAGAYESWARDLRRGRPLPRPHLGPAEERELRAAGPLPPAPGGALRNGLRPGSPLLPVGLRVAVGCAAAGWLSMGLGVGRPYWAVVTAASVFQANSVMSWQRALQRVLGNLLGLVLFTALLPVSRSGQLALILLGLLCQFGAEATIARNYWLASVFVTPMALLMTEFAGHHPAREMIADRWLDTCIGALAGLAACLLVTNRRTAGRLDHALACVRDAAHAAHAAHAAAGSAADLVPARGRLSHALVDLREAADTAAGEWWQRPLPHEHVAEAERTGHRLLATLVGQRGGGPGTAATGP